MGLIDLNINELGDIEINSNGDIGNNPMSYTDSQRLILRSMVQKLFIFNNDLQNKFIKRKIEIGLDKEVELYILEKISTAFAAEVESLMINVICLLNKQSIDVFFFYMDLTGEEQMLMRYNILL